MNERIFALTAIALLACCNHAFAANDSVRVETKSGVLAGIRDNESGLRVFKGVPFAQPPVGNLRWREPHPATPWKGARDATRFGPRCMQRALFSDMVFRSNGMSEDCLYLNIWTPAKSASEGLPVLVYFYGGGFRAGDGSEPRYDGASMARRGIVALTVNYRLDVFGMLAHPELTTESPHLASGNYTLLDQHAALKWVHENIAAFGGDPERVTIAGESAGSLAVSAQMASPLSRDLIARAIGESGAVTISGRAPTTLDQAEQNGVRLATALGVDSLAELRAIPAEHLIEAVGDPGMPPLNLIVDGYFFPKPPGQIFTAGEQAQVPLLAGSNSQESSFQDVLQDQEPTVENYLGSLDKLYGERAEEVAGYYPAASPEQVVQSATELASDRFLGFSTWKWVDVHGQTSEKPTYYYYYAHPRPLTRTDLKAGNKESAPAGAVHSAEIEYAMGNLDSNEVFAWGEADYEVSRILQGYFANFIKTGNPNGEGLPNWTAYNGDSTRPRLTIDVNTRLGPDTRRARYLLLDDIAQQDK